MNESRYSELLRTVFLKTKEGLLEWERHKTSGHKHPVFILKLGEGSIRLRLGLATNNPWYDVVLADRDGSLVDKRSGAEPPSGFKEDWVGFLRELSQTIQHAISNADQVISAMIEELGRK